MERIDKTVFIS